MECHSRRWKTDKPTQNMKREIVGYEEKKLINIRS
jgi:hypothetical protein